VWSKRHRDLGRARTQVACRLHAVLCELIAGGVSKRISAAQAGQLLAGISPAGAVEAARYELAAEFLAGLCRIDAQMRDATNKLTTAVRACGTTLTSIVGAGPIAAATVIGDAREVSRFASRDHFAACNCTAPIEVSSGHRKIYRLARRGNRRLNHAIHMAAVTQISHRHSDGRACYERKLAEGKTPKKRSGPSNAGSATPSSPSSRQTPAGPRQAHANEPGRATGERLHRPRGRLTPQAPALRPSHSRTRPPPYDPAHQQVRAQQETLPNHLTQRGFVMHGKALCDLARWRRA